MSELAIQKIDSATEVQAVPLSAEEMKLKLELENRVAVNFYEGACALRQLRDLRLYRETHSNFDDYCLDTFAFSRYAINRKIRSARVIENLKEDNCEVLPINEWQTRILAAKPPDLQRLVWREAVKRSPDKAPSGKLVRQVLQKLEIPEQLPDFAINEVCQILVKDDPDLAGKNKCWGAIFRITKTTCWLACWDGQYEVNKENLRSLNYTPEQCQLVGQLERRMQKFQQLNLEPLALAILQKIGKIESPYLSKLEEQLLSTLEMFYSLD